MGFQRMELPYGWRPVHVGLDAKGQTSMWCEVVPGTGLQRIKVWLLRDECDVPDEAEHYVGSFAHGIFICHVYTELWSI